MVSGAGGHWMEPAPLPSGFFGISLGDGKEKREDESGVFVRSTGYTCVRDLLDDLYVEYLRNRFKPLTYGKDWVLVEDTARARRVIAPWDWAVSLARGQAEVPFDWQTQASLRSCGLVAGTRWSVKEVEAKRLAAIAWRDRRLAKGIRHFIKLYYSLMADGYLEVVPPDKIIPQEYDMLQVLYNLDSDQAEGQFLRQTMDRRYEEDMFLRRSLERLERLETEPND